ncbi:MAG: ferrochelatase [Caulobacteraceae bacterium]
MASAKTGRVAVVLFNLGGPDSLAAVRPFLFNLFSDRAIIALPAPFRQCVAGLISTTRARSARANYAHMGGASPQLPSTKAQAAALQAELAGRLEGREVQVFIAMRYWRPFTAEVAKAVAAFAPDEIVLLPLYPQYSTTTTASSFAAWSSAYNGPGRTRAICCFPDLEGLVASHVERIQETYQAAGRPEGMRLLFSAHGLPQKVVDAGDPYQWQIERTCEAVAARLGPGWDWKICYQSRVGPMKWLGPSTPEAIAEAAAEGLGVLVTPIAFVSEHIETLVELDRDFAEIATEVGSPFYLRAPALGALPSFIDALAGAVEASLEKSRAVESACGGRLCPAAFSGCPVEVAR